MCNVRTKTGIIPFWLFFVHLILFFPLTNMQTLRRADKLHLPGGGEDEVLLAQQAGGRVLHPSPQAILPRLLAVGAASQGPTQPHPGSLHHSSHPGHPPHDCPGGVEEQTQRGDCVVKGQRGAGSQDLKTRGTFGPLGSTSVTKGSLLVSGWAFNRTINMFSLALGEELKDKLKNYFIDAWMHIDVKHLQRQSNLDSNHLFGLQSKEEQNCSTESDVDQDSDWWKDTVNTRGKKTLYWEKLLQRCGDIVTIYTRI